MSACLSDQDLDAFVGHSASEQELSTWSVVPAVIKTGESFNRTPRKQSEEPLN